MGLYTASIDLPFFAPAANTLSLQAWSARTAPPAAKDPYFLYAASNFGSFLALVSYPIVIEPFVRLGDQTRAWSAGFMLLIVLIAAAGAMLWVSPGTRAQEIEADADASAPTMRDAMLWMGL